MAVEFEIEYTFNVKGHGSFVAVRIQDPHGDFTLPEKPMLGAAAIERWVEQPRSVRADGRPRNDQFVFKLINPEDRATFQPGQRVFLR